MCSMSVQPVVQPRVRPSAPEIYAPQPPFSSSRPLSGSPAVFWPTAQRVLFSGRNNQKIGQNVSFLNFRRKQLVNSFLDWINFWEWHDR